jgi:hypothetical protein
MPPSAVVRLFISVETNCPVSGTGAQSLHLPWAPVPGCREVVPPLVLVLRLLQSAAEDREGEFLTNTAVSMHLARGLAKPSSMGATGQVGSDDRHDG